MEKKTKSGAKNGKDGKNQRNESSASEFTIKWEGERLNARETVNLLKIFEKEMKALKIQAARK